MRRRLAIKVLGNEEASLEDITERLGYSSATASTRAVRRLTGQTPGQLRKKILLLKCWRSQLRMILTATASVGAWIFQMWRWYL